MNSWFFRIATVAVIVAMIGVSFTPLIAQDDEPAATQPAAASGDMPDGLQSLEARMSYLTGMQIAQQLQRNPFDLDQGALIRGLKDMLAAKQPALSREQIQMTILEFEESMKQQQEETQAKSAENAEAGQAFLAKNAEREDVTVTESGLQYEVLKEGEGTSPAMGDQITVHYRGTLINGEEFDSSYKRGEPATFPLREGGLIKGWTEALPMMQEGDKWKLYLPGKLAYPGGTRGIPPNSTLIFEVELLEVDKAADGE